ncbi:MAG: SUMF1/EgtB/PvdO family nonheme iron enzyme [Planctomycetes bacterium]|nr:SUMF1/EgtB/PvdO family nonheme iron enzyme [Planctomycetota bacterium]
MRTRNVFTLTIVWISTLFGIVFAAEGMVLIPAGEFDMGDHFNVGDSDEKPVHSVSIGSFYIGATEVTTQEYCDYLNNVYSQGVIEVRTGAVYAVGGSYIYCKTTDAPTSWSGHYSRITFSNNTFSVLSGKQDHPIQMVGWYGVAAYCNWLSARDGYQSCYDTSTWECDFYKNGYRLPTEAEWEYAARGGLQYFKYPWGNNITALEANYIWNLGIPSPATISVGYYQPNDYGLYGMIGNVWEFCHDWYNSSYYSSSPGSNPQGPISGSSRVIRGGGYGSTEFSCRLANREWYNPNHPAPDVGFRIVRSSDQVDNIPPYADAGTDQTVEATSPAGFSVTLDGSGSTDPDSTPGTNNDIEFFDWYEGATLLGSGEAINYTFPLGSHTVTLVVTDFLGETNSDEVIIVVEDTIPPEITIIAPEPHGLYAAGDLVLDFSAYDVVSGDIEEPNLWGTLNGYSDPVYPGDVPGAGVYTLVVYAKDKAGNEAQETVFFVVYDPSGGFVTGGGWIDSPSGAYMPDPSLSGKANFGFISKYKKGATTPTGQTEFVFQTGDLNFHSSSYDWLVVTGSDYARFKGWGSINGEEGYRFMIWAGNGPDTFRIKIWWEDGEIENVVYDNGMDQEIGGGSIVIHTK